MNEKRSLKYLRKMALDDISDVMKGELDSYPHPWTQANFEDCIKNSMYSCWVFEQEEMFLGHLVLSASVGEAHILNLCVYPSIQGQGWGKKLLDEAEWIAKQHQAETCFLEVRPSNTAGVRLYSAAGYNEIGLRKGYYPTNSGREDALVMAKTLF